MKLTFGPTQSLQRAYEQGLRQITGRVLLPKRLEQTFQQWLAALIERSHQPDIQAASQLLAERMVSQVSAKNMRTWRAVAAKSQRSAMLYRLLQQEMQGPTGVRVQQIVRENAALISSLSIEAATTFTEEIERAQQAGDGPLPVVHVNKDQREVHQVVGIRRVQPHRLLSRLQRLQ